MMIHPMYSYFKQFETYHIEAFFYIGGNDSMDTVLKLSEYGKRIGQFRPHYRHPEDHRQ